MHKLIALLCCALLVACGQDVERATVDDSKVLAEVGDQPVTQAYLNAYLASQGMQSANAEQSAKALDALIKQMALAQMAEKSKIQLPLQQKLMLQQAKNRSLAQAAIKQNLLDNPVTEAEMRTEYERITKQLAGEEYHVRHLLYQDETQAIEVLNEIQGGADYITTEAAYLQANPNMRNVGDIGWVNIMQVPEVFREPLKTMATAAVYSRTLVSQYGVHVLYLEAKRDLVPPEFEAVKAGIMKTLEQKKSDRFQQLAVIKAKVKTSKQD
ncbi:peptidylprolyl isomerase [Marinicella sp. S1101]|uniref:peptidylprolyl isomerase n=1 Tax=Marinicella marina TaxID=2996016 RepID=UPI002260EB1D|nr:peptidylprolyl isomerase [Marinicella marina]MCX7554541.1 peptidylprolyl isomerase [Marinicella marina]MDJ1141075.1 peptidylprolyl isomerase [Marinicella marina]